MAWELLRAETGHSDVIGLKRLSVSSAAQGTTELGVLCARLFPLVSSAFLLCLATAPGAKAGSVSLTMTNASPSMTLFTISDIFASSVPATSISTPGGTYSFSFLLATAPTLTECTACSGNNPPAVFPGQFDTAAGIFQMDIMSTTFTLNGGASMVFNTPFLVQFDTSTGGNPGGFFMCFDDGSNCGTSWDIVGQQLFTGSVSSPTFVNGPASVDQVMSGYNINGSGPFQFGSAPTPEPRSIFLLGTGLLGLGFVMRRKLNHRHG